MKTIWRVSAYLLHYRGLVILTFLMALGGNGFFIATPWLIQKVLDGVVETRDHRLLIWGVTGVGVCFLLREVLSTLRIRANNTLEQKVVMDIRRDVHRKLLALPSAFYDQQKSGEIASRVVEDVTHTERALLDVTEQGAVAVMQIIGIGVLLLVQEPVLAWLVMLPLPVLAWLSYNHSKITRRNWGRVRTAAGELNSFLIEDIQGNRLIQSFGIQERERRRFLAKATKLKEYTLTAMFRWGWYSSSSNFIANLSTLAVVAVGGYLYIHDSAFSAGKLVAFFLYSRMLYEPLNRIISMNHMLSTGQASAARVFEILDHPVTIKEAPHPQPFPSGTIAIDYENVSFAYTGRKPLIQNINLHLPAGRVTALVGHTGAGKSTLASLLLRHYDVSSGTVRFNRVDVREIELKDLRRHIGIVAQDPFLFAGTIEENLRLANEDASDDDLIQALKKAQAWEFVKRLPARVHTYIGERGVRLSMGEKQRLTIARVLLRNPPVVIFDEATSSVDTITERQIQKALDTLARDRTVLVIAHRLSTVRNADQIIVLESGKIIEHGTHEQLLHANGYYTELWHHQGVTPPEDPEEPLATL